MTIEPQKHHFKTDDRIALDNNTLHAAFGLDTRIHEYAKKVGISVDDVMTYCNVGMLYPKNLNHEQRKSLNQLLAIIKSSYKKELRVVITPTVRSEVYDNRLSFSPTKPNIFFQNYMVEHIMFDEHQQKFIDELTSDLLAKQAIQRQHNGHIYTKTMSAFDGNNNPKNFDHDARIFAESVFAGVNLFTFDNDFERRELIYHVVKEFENKHPETKGISNFKIFPDVQKNKLQDKYVFEK